MIVKWVCDKLLAFAFDILKINNKFCGDYNILL